jgi:hypothetical protein
MVGSVILELISLITIRSKLVHLGDKIVLKSKKGLLLYF